MLSLAWADRVHTQVTRWTWLKYFTAMTRILLAVGFIIPSLPKITNQPFTTLGTDTAVGYYFDALHQAALYYQFIGYGQLLAGLLLLLPWTATLGAIVYFPIILNIFVLTVSIDFAGTPFVTGLMLLGNLYLLCWDYDRWRTLLPRWQRTQKRFQPAGYLLWGGIFGLAAAAFYLFLYAFNIGLLQQAPWIIMLIWVLAGIAFGFGVHWHAQRIEKTD